MFPIEELRMIRGTVKIVRAFFTAGEVRDACGRKWTDAFEILPPICGWRQKQ